VSRHNSLSSDSPHHPVTLSPPHPVIFWRAYAQLVRLPNVFTAIADICLGWLGALALGTPPSRWPSFLLLVGASSLLYSAGMVWNDFFDIEQDRRERPFRPLPSGRILRRSAASLGVALLAGGSLLATLAGVRADGFCWTPPAITAGLVTAILLYDAWLKRTAMGTVAMGSCRFLNVLLGLSVAEDRFPWSGRIYLALVVGLYIVGVTWFARTEARRSSQSALMGAAGIMSVALFLALAVPAVIETGITSVLFPYLLVALGFFLGVPILHAIKEPAPLRVQTAVKRALLGLVVLDAVLAAGLVGTIGLLMLLLLIPTLYLGRWIYST
jgi:4-hydroxybenzoate polyprenyltransferase